MKLWMLLLGGGVAAAIAAAGTASASETPSTPSSSAPPAKAAAVMAVWAELGYPLVWQQWGAWVALGESGWKIGEQNNSGGERWASTKAYQRLTNEGRMPCPIPALAPDPNEPSRMIVGKGHGSGGWYGQLAPLTTIFLHERGQSELYLTCDPAWIWLSPVLSTRTHIAQVRGTIKIAQAKLGRMPTPLELRALYGLPSRNPLEVDTFKRREQYTASTGKAGLPPEWLDQVLPPLQSLEGAGPSTGDDTDDDPPDLSDPAIFAALLAQEIEAA